MNIYTREMLEKNLKEIFFIHEKVWKFDVEGNIYYWGVI